MMFAGLNALERWQLKLVYFMAVFFSFLSGAIWGGGGVSFFYQPDLKSAFEIGSYVATILVALVGVKTMNAWRAQFKHSEKYKSVKAFQQTLDRSGVLEEYMHFLFQECADIKLERRSPDIGGFLAAAQEKQKAWFTSCAEVGRSWESMNLLLDDVEKKSFSCAPEEIESRVSIMINRVFELAFGDKPVDLLQLNSEINMLCMGVNSNFWEFRYASNNILKKLID